MKTWNERLKSRFADLKRSEGLTQSQLAERLGVAQGTVANWMSGRRSPADLKEFERIASALSVDVAWLMHGSSNSERKTPPKSGNRIPILRPDQVNPWTQNKDKVDISSNDSVPSDLVGGSNTANAFAVKATDSGMEPAICIGDIVIIDPTLNPSPGQLIALDFHGTGHLTVGKLTSKGTAWRLSMSDEFLELDKDYTSILRGRVLAVLFPSSLNM